jgi:hypothetical protein
VAIEAVLDGVRWVLIAVFALSIIEKAATLWTRSAAWHPVMLVSRGRRRHATTLMATALVADAATIVLLGLLPSVGAIAAGVLLAAYTVLALPIPSGGRGTCRCFWKVLDTTTKPAFLGRNAVLAALTTTVAAAPPSRAGLAGVAFGAVLLVGLATLVAGLNALFRPVKSTGQAERARAEGDAELSDAAFAALPQKGGEMP